LKMCRTHGAWDAFGLRTQRLRAGLMSAAPPALVFGGPFVKGELRTAYFDLVRLGMIRLGV